MNFVRSNRTCHHSIETKHHQSDSVVVLKINREQEVQIEHLPSMMKGRSSRHFMVVTLVAVLTLADLSSAKTMANPRHCHGLPKHIVVTVGKDPKTEMTINFATKWSQEDAGESAVGGVHIGTSPEKLDRYVEEQELPMKYISFYGNGKPYHSPYQHHITVDGLEPGTTYYYQIAIRKREKGPTAVRVEPIHDEPSSHHDHESTIAEAKIKAEEHLNEEEEEPRRRLGLAPYDGSDKPCPDINVVRKFTTAPPANKDQPINFAIIGDLGQFDHSRETLEHMMRHKDEFDAVMLVGDVAYTDYDHLRWDTFGDFLDDYACFDEKPLQVATGNHGKRMLSSVDEQNGPCSSLAEIWLFLTRPRFISYL
jgi:Purple acid Phosphatase, N-terminal domain